MTLAWIVILIINEGRKGNIQSQAVPVGTT